MEGILSILVIAGWWLFGLFIITLIETVLNDDFGILVLFLSCVWPIVIAVLLVVGSVNLVVIAATSLGDFIRSKL